MAALVRGASSTSLGDEPMEHDGAAAGDGAVADSGADCLCVKCGEHVPPCKAGKLTSKSKQLVHVSCVGTYKGISKKQVQDPVFKAWWAKKTPDQKDAYFKERNGQGGATARKREYAATASHSEKSSSGTNKEAMHDFIPFDCFRREHLMMGHRDEKEILSLWQQELLKKGNKVMVFKGEQLLGRWQGVRLSAFEVEQHEAMAQSEKKLKSRSDLDDFRECANAQHTANAEANAQMSAAWRPEFASTNLPQHLVGNCFEAAGSFRFSKV